MRFQQKIRFPGEFRFLQREGLKSVEIKGHSTKGHSTKSNIGAVVKPVPTRPSLFVTLTPSNKFFSLYSYHAMKFCHLESLSYVLKFHFG